MDWTLLTVQLLNGLQLGILLFLLASGLTLIFGIMDFVNLAHGSLYMVGAFFCATFTQWLDSFLLGLLLALPATAVIGLLVELVVVRRLYQRDHLDHVLATFGLILVFDTLTQMIWGPDGQVIPLPAWLDGQIALTSDIVLPTYRIAIIVTGLAVAFGLFVLVNADHTATGEVSDIRLSNSLSNQRFGDWNFKYIQTFCQHEQVTSAQQIKQGVGAHG